MQVLIYTYIHGMSPSSLHMFRKVGPANCAACLCSMQMLIYTYVHGTSPSSLHTFREVRSFTLAAGGGGGGPAVFPAVGMAPVLACPA